MGMLIEREKRLMIYEFLECSCNIPSGLLAYTLNANMADHSVGTRDKLHESEASEASVFCFDNASPEKSCFVDCLVCLI